MGISVFPAAGGGATVNGYSSGPTSARPTTVGSTFFDTTLNELLILTTTGWVALVDPITPPVAVSATETGSGVSVVFNVSTWPGTITNYRVTSSTGLSTTGASSPLVISETTSGTFTYFVQAVTPNGLSAPSNTVTSSFTAFSATGGTITSDATHVYNTFTTSGTWTPSKNGKAYEVLVVGGGTGGSPANHAGNSSFGATVANGWPNSGGLPGGSGSGNRNGTNGTFSGWAPINSYVGSSGGAGGTPFNGNNSGGTGGSGAGNGGSNGGAAATSATTYGSGGGGPNSTNTGNWGGDGGIGGQVVTTSGTSVANVGISVVVGAGSLGTSNGMTTGGNGFQGVVVVRYLK